MDKMEERSKLLAEDIVHKLDQAPHLLQKMNPTTSLLLEFDAINEHFPERIAQYLHEIANVEWRNSNSNEVFVSLHILILRSSCMSNPLALDAILDINEHLAPEKQWSTIAIAIAKLQKHSKSDLPWIAGARKVISARVAQQDKWENVHLRPMKLHMETVFHRKKFFDHDEEENHFFFELLVEAGVSLDNALNEVEFHSRPRTEPDRYEQTTQTCATLIDIGVSFNDILEDDKIPEDFKTILALHPKVKKFLLTNLVGDAADPQGRKDHKNRI